MNIMKAIISNQTHCGLSRVLLFINQNSDKWKTLIRSPGGKNLNSYFLQLERQWKL